MSYVVVKTEMPVVDPNRMILKRNEVQLLSIAGDQVEIACGGLLDSLKIDTAFAATQLGGFVDECRRNVHVAVRCFHQEKGIVLGGESFRVGFGHGVLV